MITVSDVQRVVVNFLEVHSMKSNISLPEYNSAGRYWMINIISGKQSVGILCIKETGEIDTEKSTPVGEILYNYILTT